MVGRPDSALKDLDTAIELSKGKGKAGSNAFCQRGVLLRKEGRHDEAMEELTRARDKWNKDREKRLDFLNERLRKEKHATYTFRQVDDAMRLYADMFPNDSNLLPEPNLSDFYTPSEDQKDKEIAFVTLGMTGLFLYSAYKIKKWKRE